MRKGTQQPTLFPIETQGSRPLVLTLHEARQVITRPLVFGDAHQVEAKQLLAEYGRARSVIEYCVAQDHKLTSEKCLEGCLDFLPVNIRRIALDEFWKDVAVGRA